MPKEIHVSAILICDPAGQVLHVRKQGTHTFMLPGGKPEPGEHPRDTALREFHEELGVPLTPDFLTEHGVFSAAAANEAHHTVVAHVFSHPYVAHTSVSAEIEQLEWIHPSTDRADVAPLNLEILFPAMQSGALTITTAHIPHTE